MQREPTPNRLVGKDAWRKYRADVNACEALVAKLYADPNVRSACLMQLAESILDAHAVSASSWGVTLLEAVIRLNVGGFEALVLSKEALYLNLDQAATTDDEWTRVTEQPGVTLKRGSGPFKAIPSAYLVLVSGNQLELRLPELQPMHAAFVTRAAKTVRTRTRFFESHSPGVMALLRREVADDLPDPDYGIGQSTSERPRRRYWKISPGEGAKLWNEFQQQRWIAVGWGGSPDLRSIGAASKQEFREKIEILPAMENYSSSHAASQLWIFFKEMQPGDLVCAYGAGRILGWGEIASDYGYNDGVADYAHQRKVEWESTEPVAASTLPDALATKLKQNTTVIELTAEEFSRITSEPAVAETATIPNVIGDFTALLRMVEAEGLHFSAELVSNYLLALQTKRFVILTGISGTGKTQLALAVASHFQQSVKLPRTSQLPDGALIVTVRPHSLKYGHMVLPTTFTANLVHPPAGRSAESRQIRVEFPEGEQWLTISKDAARDVTNLFFKGPFRKWFIETFEVGSQFAIELLESDDETPEALRLHVPNVVQQSQLLANYLVSAVRPDWSDNRGLLGYFNPLINSYVVTPFLRLLLDAREEVERAAREGREPAPFFVILDEMNLARVEHYFSDFLSALESGEPIHLHDHAGIEEGETEDSIAIPRNLRVPENVFFTGTVNVDETTYMFSPKVLDRAFTIELNRVDLATFGAEQPSAESNFTLSRFAGSLGTARKPTTTDWVAFGHLLGGELIQVVRDLHTLLSEEDRHFGYRVANEIARFVVLASEQTDGSNEALWTALDLAVLEKVLPKFHGTQQELEDVLTHLSAFAEPRPLPRTTAKIQSMLRRLRRQGFTSFIE